MERRASELSLDLGASGAAYRTRLEDRPDSTYFVSEQTKLFA